jgi:glycosyltransferase involved in cell wall biosynthesis/predicted metal-dependent phosphoesterase TrpH
MIKVDLHLHSKYSDKPAGFFSKKLEMQESYMTPQKIYDTLFERGMTHITITDHDAIGGCLEIAHLPNTFISEEATVYFPEDRCKIHVLCYDISKQQHEQIQQLRYNVYELVDYLQAEHILHVLAHPLYDMDGKLSASHIERCLLLFDNWEVINGTRSGISAKLTQEIIDTFDGDAITQLEAKYGFNKRQREHISVTGGSDDHGGLDIGTTYTQMPGETMADFHQAFENRTTQAMGNYGSPVRLTHMIMNISHQWSEAKQNNGSYLLEYLFSTPKMSMINKMLGLKKVVEKVKSITGIEPPIDEQNRHETIHTFFKNFFPHIIKEFSHNPSADFEKVSLLLGQSLLSVVPTAFYLSVYWQRALEKKRSRQIYRAVTHSKKDIEGKVAYFTDTFHEINGVALTSKKLYKLAQEKEYNITFITAYDKNVNDPYRKNFTPLISFKLPEYEEIPVNIPHFLDMLEYCDQENFDVIYASTPGVVGLYAFFIARILHLPFVTTFHTDFPEYIGRYSGDHLFKKHIWNAFALLFNSADRVLSPSKAYRKTLIAHGVKKKKIVTFTRGVNHEKFNPDHRKSDFWNRFDPNYQGEKVVLYVGRVAKEKNLDIFTHVYTLLKEDNRVKFVIVGDGPERPVLEEVYGDSIYFTGFLEAEVLSQAFASADIFLFPSQTETFGNVVLEAQACGLVPIVSSVGAVKENVLDKESGFVISENNPFKYAAAIKSLLDNPSMLFSMRQNALNFMKDKSEGALLEEMLQTLSLGKLQKRVS